MSGESVSNCLVCSAYLGENQQCPYGCTEDAADLASIEKCPECNQPMDADGNCLKCGLDASMLSDLTQGEYDWVEDQ